jgi:hypothetical protein
MDILIDKLRILWIESAVDYFEIRCVFMEEQSKHTADLSRHNLQQLDEEPRKQRR